MQRSNKLCHCSKTIWMSLHITICKSPSGLCSPYRPSWLSLCKTWQVECSCQAPRKRRNTSYTWFVGLKGHESRAHKSSVHMYLQPVLILNRSSLFVVDQFWNHIGIPWYDSMILCRLKMVRSTLALTKRMAWSVSTITPKNTTTQQCSTKLTKRWDVACFESCVDLCHVFILAWIHGLFLGWNNF